MTAKRGDGLAMVLVVFYSFLGSLKQRCSTKLTNMETIWNNGIFDNSAQLL